MNIIIGRESSKLKIVVEDKPFLFGEEGSVPQSVSREHLRVEVGVDGKIVLYNLKPTNTTFVGGLAISSKSVEVSDIVELGVDRYFLDLPLIVSLAREHIAKAVPKPAVCNMSSLEVVWEEYDGAKLKNQIKERKMASVRSVTGIFSMMAIVCSFIPAAKNYPALPIVLYGLAFTLTILFFVTTYRASARQPVFLKKLDGELRQKYVCPNCRRFLGYQSYNEILRSGQCPACKSKFIN